MRSIASDSFRFNTAEHRKAHSLARRASSLSWFSLAESNADRAASTGFVFSMMFLAMTAVYAFSLSDEAKPFFQEAASLVSRAAFDAGFRLDDISVSGARNTPQSELEKALGLPFSRSSLFYDATEARSRLLNVGWIESAEVRRFLPSRLEAVISERTPFARWEDAAHTVQVIDREGHLLGPDAEGQFKNLPLFAGDDAPALASSFEDALQGHEALTGRIQRVELVADRFWAVKLDNGPLLKLPRKLTPLALGRLESLLANPKVAGLGLETIDLRLANRTILQLQEPTVANRDKAIAVLTSAPQRPLPAPGKGKAL